MKKYCSKVTAIGPEALSLLEANMLIIFNNNAPAELAEITVMHTIETLSEDVKKGDIVTLGGHDYEVLFVGTEANSTLKELGHCTFYLYGEGVEYRELPGYIILNSNVKPNIEIGQTIEINYK